MMILPFELLVLPVVGRNLNKSLDDFENSRVGTNTIETSLDSYSLSKSFNQPYRPSSSSILTINDNLPDAQDIRNLPALKYIVKISDDGKMLENKHRCAIAKAIIDECLNLQPDRVLVYIIIFKLIQNLYKILIISD